MPMFSSIQSFFNDSIGVWAFIQAAAGAGAFAINYHRHKKKHENMARSWTTKLFRVLGIMLIASSMATCTVWAVQDRCPDNDRTCSAWKAYENGEFSTAIYEANRKCIREFRREADRDQKRLLDEKVAAPGKGRVSDQERDAIFARGVLNDVATCYWIVGKSSEKLDKLKDARSAYEKCATYPYARTWDDKEELFWNPAENCADKLKDLEESTAGVK